MAVLLDDNSSCTKGHFAVYLKKTLKIKMKAVLFFQLIVVTCGYVYASTEFIPRVVNGTDALQGQLPYMLSFQQNGTGHYCGSTLVEVEGVQIGITAAHCIDDVDMRYTNYTLVAGELVLSQVTGIEQTRRVMKLVIHPNFTDLVYNDVAVVIIDRPFDLNDNVKPVALPVQGQVTTQGNLTISGWGAYWFQGPYPDNLQVIKLPMFNHTACKKIYDDLDFRWHVEDSMICAGDSSTRYICQGDSGGPAVSDAGYLAGIVSWGYTLSTCGQPNVPAVFQQVSSHTDWIQQVVAMYRDKQ